MYNKAQAVIEPFAFDKYRKEKIKQQIEANRPNRLQIKSNLPKVNQEVALKFMEEKETARKKKTGVNLLDDNRFKAMFENPEFEIDKNAVEYKMLTPVLTRLDKAKVKELKIKAQKQQFADMQMEEDAKSSDDDLFSEKDEDEEANSEVDEGSSDDDDRREFARDMKKQFKQIKKDKIKEEREEEAAALEQKIAPKMIEVETNEFRVKSVRKKNDKYVDIFFF